MQPIDAGRRVRRGAGHPHEAVGGGWIGYLSYPDAAATVGRAIPQAAGGWTDVVLRLDRIGLLVVRKPLRRNRSPAWVAEALTIAAPLRAHAKSNGAQPDSHAHHAACWPAWRRSAPARSTRPACARSSSARCPARRSTSSPTRSTRTAPARAAYVAGRLGRGGIAVTGAVPSPGRRRRHVESDQGHSAVARITFGAARFRQGRGREHHDRRPRPQRPRPRRRHRFGDRSRATGGARAAPGVWHLVSTVAARVDPDVPMSALLTATFPPASVTGTPKAAPANCSQWEPRRRGIYCGTVGLASPIAGTELNVAIRTVEFDAGGAAVLGVGGGITADSDPDAEWQECLHKAAPIVQPGSQLRARAAPRRRAHAVTARQGCRRSPRRTRP